MMKRVSVNSHQSRLIDDDARIKHRHQSLLQDYLELQKELVSQKKKLQAASQKRATLLAEVRFLRRRHKYLQHKPSPKTETQIVQNQNSHLQPELTAKEKKYNVNGTVPHGQSRVLDTKSISDILENEGGMGKETTVLEPIRLQKQPKNYLINGKKVGKKKISVQDQVVFEF